MVFWATLGGLANAYAWLQGGGQGLDYVIKIFSATEKNAMVNIIWISPDPDKYTYILRLVIKIVKSFALILIRVKSTWNFHVVHIRGGMVRGGAWILVRVKSA